MNDIAICGKDTRFCRMLELELSTMGYTVVRNPHGGSYRLWIVDLDTVTPTPGTIERCYLGVTWDTASLSEEKRLLCHVLRQRPLKMDAFREEVTRLLFPERPLSRTVRTRPLLSRAQAPARGFELNGTSLALTDTEELILAALYARRGETVSRDELCALLGNESNGKLADVYICLLRKKLEANGTPRLLFTVRGVGYRLVEEK